MGEGGGGKGGGGGGGGGGIAIPLTITLPPLASPLLCSCSDTHSILLATV